MATAPTAFSTAAEEAIRRRIQTARRPSITFDSIEEFEDAYEIRETADWIRENDYKKTCLQFPDDLLCDSITVSEKIESLTGRKPYILADTSYGSCCVDEVAAAHVESDSIVHYGPACLSRPVASIPVYYVYPQRELEPEQLEAHLREHVPSMAARIEWIVVLSEITYERKLDSVAALLQRHFPSATISISRAIHPLSNIDCPLGPDPCPGGTKVASLNRAFYLPLTDELKRRSAFFYVGKTDSVLLTLAMMAHPEYPFYGYSPKTDSFGTADISVNKTLRRRLFLVEKAKDAQTIGIVVGTLGVANLLDVISRLKQLCKAAGKKVFTFSVGKPNVPKLASYPEVDVFVHISCPFGVLLDSSKEYLKPIITPFELEVACGARQWHADSAWVSDFHQLLNENAPIPEELRTDVSLITGKLRSMGKTDQGDGQPSFEQPRSWLGLDSDLVTDDAALAEGLSGVAQSYASESVEKS